MQEYIAWTDVETTGVDERDENAALLEVACIVTDLDYNEVDQYEAVIHYDFDVVRELANNVTEYVYNMHKKTGLWDRLSEETAIPLDVVDKQFSAFLSKYAMEVAPLLAGNSITLDRNFLREFLPNSFSKFHYRSIDMSSVDIFIKNMGIEFVKESTGTHNALTDIQESILQAKQIKELLQNR